MKRESLITNTERLLFDILETMKKIEENTNPLSFIKDAVNDKPNGIVVKTNEKSNVKANESKKKVNVKKGAKK